jgi:protease-4
MAEKRSNLLLWIVVGGGAFLFVVLSLIALLWQTASGPSSSFSSSFSLSSNEVAVLEVEGIIVDSKEFVDQLKDYGNRGSVRAVVLHLNTPGGGVAASQEMYEAVLKFRAKTHKQVVVSMSSVAASGGYYLAAAADRIFADPGTITGSIGVIAEWFNYGDLLRWAKLQSITFKSGPLKDAGSPTRPLTEEEKVYFQSLINTMYSQFVSAVAAGRKMTVSDVRKLADGRVYTGEEAKSNGLIDELGTLQDAVAAAGRMAGISGEPRIVTPPRKSVSLLDLLLGDARTFLQLDTDRSEANIRFQYLWR